MSLCFTAIRFRCSESTEAEQTEFEEREYNCYSGSTSETGLDQMVLLIGENHNVASGEVHTPTDIPNGEVTTVHCELLLMFRW